ncbi:hypothetical protein R4J17_06600 [Brachyspira intermedia]|uniref:hypothetical protein n=1 Tax=Brachyspira intermedia TaxID=84377 RepID=UPI003006FB1E
MKNIMFLLPVIIALLGKIFSLSTPAFIYNFQIGHPIIYGIIGGVIIIFYICFLALLFDTDDKDKEEVYGILYIIIVPIVFYLLANLLSIKMPNFIINFGNAHPIISSIIIGIISGLYLLIIIAGAGSVIELKKYSSPRIIFALIPALTIILLYIFNIGVPPFIMNFYNNHKIWFYIVFIIAALSYICVLFSLVSFSNASRTALVFIIAFAVLTFMFRDQVLFFNNISDNKVAVSKSLNDKDNISVNNNIENEILTEENNVEENNNNESNNLIDNEYSSNDISIFIEENFDKIVIVFAVLAVMLVILFIIKAINNSKNGVNITYTKDGDTFKLKGKKDNFVITKNGKHSFLVKDGIIVAYKPAFKFLEKFKFYGKSN